MVIRLQSIKNYGITLYLSWKCMKKIYRSFLKVQNDVIIG